MWATSTDTEWYQKFSQKAQLRCQTRYTKMIKPITCRDLNQIPIEPQKEPQNMLTWLKFSHDRCDP